MKLSVFLAIAVLSAGCASVMGVKQGVHTCYFGEAYAEQCQKMDVAEGESLICVDMSKQVQFEIMDCDIMLNKSKPGAK